MNRIDEYFLYRDISCAKYGTKLVHENAIDVDEMVLSILPAFKIACSSSKLDLVSEFVINSESTEVESQ